MTCEEFERVLPEVENDRSREQKFHLDACTSCADLVADLNAISQQARLLRDTDDPSPRVWNSIEVALLQEGLIRETATPFLVPVRRRNWRAAWMLPVAAVLLLTAGVVRYERRASQPNTAQNVDVTPAVIADASTAGDQQLLEAVSRRTPAMRASYEANLRDVDSYIHDAQESLKTNPNDEQAQQYLLNAYEQKSMVYQMALQQ
jgi:hypothetical protein